MLTVILTGGNSSRMGRDKAMLQLDGQTMSSILIKKYSALGPVAVAVNKRGRFPAEGAIELVDDYPGFGPLNGIISAFSKTDAQMIFLTATDLPNGDPRLVEKLCSISAGYDACVIRRSDGNLEPLFALYCRNCLEVAGICIDDGYRSLNSLIKMVNTRYVCEDELDGFELDRILVNVNTPDEYKKLTEGNDIA